MSVSLARLAISFCYTTDKNPAAGVNLMYLEHITLKLHSELLQTETQPYICATYGAYRAPTEVFQTSIYSQYQ